MREKISVTVCTESIATCNGCSARSYVSSIPGAGGKTVDKIYELQIGNGITRICRDCLRELKVCVEEALQ